MRRECNERNYRLHSEALRLPSGVHMTVTDDSGRKLKRVIAHNSQMRAGIKLDCTSALTAVNALFLHPA